MEPGKGNMPKVWNARQAIREGVAEWQEAEREAYRTYVASSMCHCCCCTGECTYAFQEAPEWQQAEWMEAYWASIDRELTNL